MKSSFNRWAEEHDPEAGGCRSGFCNLLVICLLVLGMALVLGTFVYWLIFQNL